MSIFDPNTFLNATFTESNSTEYVPIPVGEFAAFAESVKIEPWQKRDDPSKSGLRLDIVWNITDDNVKQLLARDVVKVTQGIMLDLTEGGNLDFGKGKNVNLGRVRAAVGLNNPGQPFSFGQIMGRAAKISIKHDMYEGNILSKVSSIAAV